MKFNLENLLLKTNIFFQKNRFVFLLLLFIISLYLFQNLLRLIMAVVTLIVSIYAINREYREKKSYIRIAIYVISFLTIAMNSAWEYSHPIIIKTDVLGTIEAIKHEIEKISVPDNVRVRVVLV